MKVKVLLLSAVALFSLATNHVQSQEPASYPSLVSAIRVEPPLEFCGEEAPIGVQEVRESPMGPASGDPLAEALPPLFPPYRRDAEREWHAR